MPVELIRERMIKKIFITIGIVLLLSGCNSLASSSNLNVENLANEDKILPTYESVDKIIVNMPDYAEVDKETKFDHIAGPAAFFIPEQYSDKKEDLQSFDFLGRIRKDTLLYSYATRVVSGSQTGQEVHCVAEYNYETMQYREIHSVIDGKTEELEPFHVSILYDGEIQRGLAVYDNGSYYYYDMDGNLIIQTSIGKFISKQYSKNASIQISEVVNPSKYRMYLLLNLQTGDITTGFDPKDWDKLESEMDKKIVTRLLAYDLQLIDGIYECVQEISNYQDAVDYWADLADGQDFTSIPDKDEDWKKATAEYPLEAGNIYLLKDGKQWPVYTWNEENGFLSEDKDGLICNFKVDMNKVKQKTEVVDSQFQKEDLVIIEDRYYGISGLLSPKKVETDIISRVYNFIDEDGNSHEKEQVIEVPKYYRSMVDKGFLEGYWLLHKDISSIYAAVDSDILVLAGNEIVWQNENGDRESVFKDTAKDSTAVYVPSQSGAYIFMSGEENLFIQYDKMHSSGSGNLKIPYSLMSFSFKNENGVYDQKLEDYVGNDFQLYNSREKFGKNQILDLGKNRFLIASQNNGLLLFESNSNSMRQISKGTWLSLWKDNDKVVAIGFDSNEKSFEMKDLLYGKIKEYKISDF